MAEVTFAQWQSFGIVLAAVLGFVVLLNNAIKAYRDWKQPKDDLEAWRNDVDTKLNKDNDRLKNLEDGNKVICRGILALLSHEINGNSTDKLKSSQSEITNYLIDR